MAQVGQVAEGLFAINKPPSVSSAQAIRDLQQHFRSSELFAPLLRQQAQQAQRSSNGKMGWKQRRAAKDVKIGHGGTLDPLATGVLVIGVGRGTKQLNTFLSCTKTYETVVLFGKSTDTYDVSGKAVSSAPFEHLTKTSVEEKLAAFRGTIQQIPPIYSALSIDGMRAYEYARLGKELPRELKAREMVVEECELVEWYAGGKHEYRWPATEASTETKEAISESEAVVEMTAEARKRDISSVTEVEQSEDPIDEKRRRLDPDSSPPAAAQNSPSNPSKSRPTKAEKHTHSIGPLSSTICPAPAARIRVTASSGFYVRSFAYDLGIACESAGTMAELSRSRQGEYSLSEALTYDELSKGESEWGPKLTTALNSWMQRQSGPSVENPVSERRPSPRRSGHATKKNPRAGRTEDSEQARPNTSSEGE